MAEPTIYKPALPNKYDEHLIPVKIRDQYFEEYLGLSPLTSFMGTSPYSAIQVFEMKAGEGMSYRVPARKELDYENPVIGFNQAAGSEQQPKFYHDEIKLDLRRFVDQLSGVHLVKQMTPVAVYNSLQPLLLNVQRRNLVKTILDAGTIELYTPLAKNQGGTGPSEHRGLYAGIGEHKDTVFEGVGKMAGNTYDKNGLSVAHIRTLKSMAVTGGTSFEAESKIRPVELKTRKGFPEELYVYLMDTESYKSLVEDPAWKQFVYRGVLQGNDQPEGISGARYRGMVEGVMIYECPELARYRVKSGAKIAAWNLFLGAQAFGLVWAKRPWFELESRDFNLNKAMAVCEIRGQKALQFPSLKDPNKHVEQGIIHSFVQIA